MNKGNKRWTTWLCMFLAVIMLAACTGNNGSGETAGSTNSGESGGNQPLDIKMFAGLYNEIPDMNNEYWTEWEKRTNAKLDIEWVPSGDLDTKLDLLLASGDLPEVVAYQNQIRPTLITAIKNGAFWDLTPFLGDLSEYPNLKENLAPDALKYLSVDGGIYAVPRSRSRVDGGLKIREDWLKKLNLPIPKTFEEYREALKKIVDSDMDGNGKKDTVGLLFVNNPPAMFQAGFGAYNPTYDNDGGLMSPGLTPQYVEMVEWFRELYADGLLSKEYAVMKESQAEELFKTNRAASYGRPIWWDHEWEQAMKKSGQPDAKILNLSLTGPHGDAAVGLETGVAGGFYISKKVPEEKVKQLLKYFDLTASQEMTDFAYYGIEGTHYTEQDGQKVLTEQGVKEVNTTSKGAGVLAYAKWGKVISASGDKAYNDAKIKEVENFDEIGKIDFYRVITSEAWRETWPKYADEYSSMLTRTIVGQISVEEFRAYVDKLNSQPDIKQAYQEMAKAYEQFNQQ
ncbi:putative aldouronate transport system substrate-binding protein [Paenibacillus sp. PvP094]|uniref:extracellular solute-binding protein n=1 Tax=Paenibacillus sp. PvP094 TaxID=3156394 RepID=UPI00339B3C66